MRSKAASSIFPLPGGPALDGPLTLTGEEPAAPDGGPDGPAAGGPDGPAGGGPDGPDCMEAPIRPGL